MGVEDAINVSWDNDIGTTFMEMVWTYLALPMIIIRHVLSYVDNAKRNLCLFNMYKSKKCQQKLGLLLSIHCMSGCVKYPKP